MSKKRPSTAWILIGLLIFIGIGALISGPLLFAAPDGHLVGFSTDMLQGTPFSNYIIPGIILFVFIGIFPVFTAFSLIKKPGCRWPDSINIFKNFYWAWTAAWAVGAIMIIWIAVETALLGYISFLQPLIFIWGLIIIILDVLPGVRRFYQV